MSMEASASFLPCSKEVLPILVSKIPSFHHILNTVCCLTCPFPLCSVTSATPFKHCLPSSFPGPQADIATPFITLAPAYSKVTFQTSCFFLPPYIFAISSALFNQAPSLLPFSLQEGVWYEEREKTGLLDANVAQSLKSAYSYSLAVALLTVVPSGNIGGDLCPRCKVTGSWNIAYQFQISLSFWQYPSCPGS